MKTNKLFLILLVLSVFLLLGTSCMVYRHHPQQRGEIITTRPYGRANRERHERRIIITDEHNEKHNARDKEKKHRRDDDDDQR